MGFDAYKHISIISLMLTYFSMSLVNLIYARESLKRIYMLFKYEKTGIC